VYYRVLQYIYIYINTFINTYFTPPTISDHHKKKKSFPALSSLKSHAVFPEPISVFLDDLEGIETGLQIFALGLGRGDVNDSSICSPGLNAVVFFPISGRCETLSQLSRGIKSLFSPFPHKFGHWVWIRNSRSKRQS
jgi:hypothetical protein